MAKPELIETVHSKTYRIPEADVIAWLDDQPRGSLHGDLKKAGGVLSSATLIRIDENTVVLQVSVRTQY